MKLFKRLLLILLILFIGSAIYVALQPSSYNISRSLVIDAPKELIYSEVSDFKNWSEWSPWFDENSKLSTNNVEKSTPYGDSYSWIGKDGIYTMSNQATTQDYSVLQELKIDDYLISKVFWKLSPTNQGTKVILGMTSDDVSFKLKLYSLINGGIDNMFGADLENGLKKLNLTIMESVKKYSITINGVTNHGGGYYLYLSASCKIDDFQDKMNEMLPKLTEYVEKNKLTTSGAPFIIYHEWNELNNRAIFSCAIPTPYQIIPNPNSTILSGQLRPFKCVRTTLTGDYSNLKEAWEKSMLYLTENNMIFDTNGTAIESYLTYYEMSQNPSNWVTELFLPIKE